MTIRRFAVLATLYDVNGEVETPLRATTAIVHASENVTQLVIDLKQALWSQTAAAEEKIAAAVPAPVARSELRRGTHCTLETVLTISGLLYVNSTLQCSRGWSSVIGGGPHSGSSSGHSGGPSCTRLQGT